MKYLIFGIFSIFAIYFFEKYQDKTAAEFSITSLADGTELKIPKKISRGKEAPIRPLEKDTIYNREAIIPPQCYTKHLGNHNPCMVCHQNYEYSSRPNAMNDRELQSEYAFSEVGETNRWKNLFEDRSEAIKKISDQDVIDYIYTDNYSPLIESLKKTKDWEGPIPEIKNYHLGQRAFDDIGFAKDNSHWVAFNYKPFPSTFWPTNGSTDDVLIRLPEEFRTSSCKEKKYSRDTYIVNLSILEISIKDLKEVSIPQVDENRICEDVNGDGKLSLINSVPAREFYIGGASAVKTHKMLYPEGVEFIHSVRYVGLDGQLNIVIPPRMKELRYMKKHKFYSKEQLLSNYTSEHQEKRDGKLPNFVEIGDRGLNNGFGWSIMGFIENKDGDLRKQNFEENFFCMGCHTSMGATIDQTFAFPRKVTGKEGWGYIDLKGMKDAPNEGFSEAEILTYLMNTGGGNEFRENKEMEERWFDSNGKIKVDKVKKADVYDLITPSPKRAMDLNKAYMLIVKKQSFIYGRDATISPAKNVYTEVNPEKAPVLPENKIKNWDIRLNWNKKNKDL